MKKVLDRCELDKNSGAYYPFISLLRVLAMISIVAGHWCSYADIYLYDLGGIGVEVFLAISGFLCGKKRINNYKVWIKRRFFRVLMPVWIWAIILFIANVFVGKYVFSLLFSCVGLTGIHFITPFSIGGCSGMEHTWYITVILLCYLLTFFLEKYYDRIEKHIVIVFLTLMFLQIAMTAIGVQICYFILFFAGYFIGRKNVEFTKKLLIGSVVSSLLVGTVRVLCSALSFENRFYDMVIARWSMAFIGFAALVIFWLCISRAFPNDCQLENNKVFR